MKKIFLYLVLGVLLGHTNLLAQQVAIVSGHVTQNGVAVSGIPIVLESFGQSPYTSTVLTNANGYYVDTAIVQGSGVILISSFCSVDTVAFNPNQLDYTVDIDCSNGLGNCIAAFTYNPTSGNTVTFAPLGQGNLSYSWDFGDGNGSSMETPQHTYANPGVYNVCLAITDSSAGCSDYQCLPVRVGNTGGGSCQAFFTSFNLQGNTFQFQDSSLAGPNALYAWDFGDGTSSNQQNPVTSFQSAGVYQVCLTVIDSSTVGGCVDTYCENVFVGTNNTCSADFTFNQTVSGSFVFGAIAPNPALQYSWDLGNGASASGPTVTQTFNTPGSYVVCLTIADSSSNCFDTQCQTITVGGGNTCDASFSYLDVGNNQYQFFGDTSSAAVFFWDFGDGDSTSGVNPQHTYNSPGVYTVCLFVTDNSGCQDFQCQTIVVGGGGNGNNCLADFEVLPFINGTVQFLNLSQGFTPNGPNFNSYWDFGDGTTSNAQNPVHTYTTGADSFYVCLTITSSNTCADTLCKWILNIPDTTGGFGCDAAFAAHNAGNNVVAFNSLCPSPNLTYNWNFGDGNTDNTAAPAHTYANPGVYYVCLTVVDSLANCNATFCDSVYVGNYGSGPGACNVIADFTYQDLGNGSFSFTELSSAAGIPGSGAGLNFFWIFSDSTVSTDPNPTHTFLGQGPFFACLTVSDSSGNCVASTCQVVGTTNPNSGFHISGAVFADSQLVDNGVVYLIQHDTTAAGGTLTAVDSTYLSQSFYTFFNVQPGTYLVKSALLPASPFYLNYMPTYLGDELLWNNATSVVVTNQNQILPYISLVPGNNPGGPGFIGGAISAGANKSSDGLPGVSVLLMTEQGQAVVHTLTDDQGEYEFKSLAFGTYHLYVEIPGKLSEKWEVTLDANGQRFEQADFKVMDAEVLASGTTGINEFSFGDILSVFPNPSQGLLNLEVEMTEQKDLKISVMNLVGQTLMEKSVPQVIGTRRIELELDGLIDGTYLLKVEADGESLNRLIIKRK